MAQITLLEDALARCIPKGRPVLLMDLAGDPPSQLADLVARNTREEGEGGRGVLGTTRGWGGGVRVEIAVLGAVEILRSLLGFLSPGSGLNDLVFRLLRS